MAVHAAARFHQKSALGRAVTLQHNDDDRAGRLLGQHLDRMAQHGEHTLEFLAHIFDGDSARFAHLVVIEA